MSYLTQLADHYSTLHSADVPAAVRLKARFVLADFLSVYIAGLARGPLSEILLQYAGTKTGEPAATVPFTDRRTDAETAALVCAAIAHSVELDDGHRYGTAHPSVAVIPPLLAVAQTRDVTCRELLAAVAVGYDWMLRTARAINPSHLERGFHSTSTAGTLGSAAAVAHLMGFAPKANANAVSIAALLSSGLQEMLHDRPEIKAFQVGRSAQSGLLAATMAARGCGGPDSIYEGAHGWIAAMTDRFHEADLIGDLGRRWEIMNTYTKLYPTCRHCHAPIDLALDLHAQGLRPTQVRQIEIRTYTVAIDEVGGRQPPESLQEAMFSLRYALAVALHEGELTTASLVARLAEESVRGLARRIDVTAAPERDRRYPESRGCDLLVRLNDGNILQRSAELPKGEPDTPLTPEEHQEKFRRLTRGCIPHSVAEALWKCIMDTDEEAGADPLFSLLASSP